jgi:hypothetical protein
LPTAVAAWREGSSSASRTLDSPWPGITSSVAGGTTSAPLVPNPVLPTTTGNESASVRTTKSARPDGASGLTSGSVRAR